MAALLGGERLEAAAGRRHQFRRTREVPVGVGHLGMADIGRKGGEGVVDVSALALPALYPSANESVSQVMDADLVVGAAGNHAGIATKQIGRASCRDSVCQYV